MKEILNKSDWLFFPLLIVSLVQGLSTFMFSATLFDVTFNYIFTGVFKYSEIQKRIVEVAGFMQLPALLFWLFIFIISKKAKTNDT